MNHVMYIFIDSGSYASQLMFLDLKECSNVIETSEVFAINNRIIRFLNKVHMSLKIKKYIELPFKRIWDKYCILEKYKNYKETKIVVLTNVSIRKLCLSYLKVLRNNFNFQFILVSVDSSIIKDLSPVPYLKSFPFEKIYSFDKKDCLKYNIAYTNSLYSRVNNILPSDNSSDIFFIGRSNNRDLFVKSVARRALQHNLSCNFNILGVPRREREFIPGVDYLTRIVPYNKVLCQIVSSKCLLDLVRKGQEGMTMRVYEAIFYNKMLITNNPNVRTLSYYNPNYMQVISSVEDINFETIKETKFVDYGYKGDYSPTNFIHQIEEDLNLFN